MYFLCTCGCPGTARNARAMRQPWPTSHRDSYSQSQSESIQKILADASVNVHSAF